MSGPRTSSRTCCPRRCSRCRSDTASAASPRTPSGSHRPWSRRALYRSPSPTRRSRSRPACQRNRNTRRAAGSDRLLAWGLIDVTAMKLLLGWIIGAAAFAPPRRLAIRRADAARLSAKALDETLASMDVDIMDPSMESRSTLDGCEGRLLNFVQGWVVMWEDTKAAGLTTPVEIENTADGARVLSARERLRFARRGEEERERGRVEGGWRELRRRREKEAQEDGRPRVLRRADRRGALLQSREVTMSRGRSSAGDVGCRQCVSLQVGRRSSRSKSLRPEVGGPPARA